MGDRSWIAANTSISSDLVMGEDITINMYTVLEGSVTIGSGVRIAPRPLLIQQGLQDYVPMDLVESALEKLRSAYGVAGGAKAKNSLGIDFFTGGHQFNSKGAFNWLKTIEVDR